MAIFKFKRSPFNLFPYVIIKTKQGFIKEEMYSTMNLY